jgi:ABC-type multidrug transport system fused ATPase/permease subunit
MRAARKILSLATAVRGYVAATTALRLAALASVIVQGLLLATLLDDLRRGRGPDDEVGLLIAVGALALARTALLAGASIAGELTGAATKTRLRRRAFAALADQGPGRTAGARVGELKAALVEDIEALDRYYGTFLPSLATVAIGPAAIVVVLATYDIGLAAVLAGFVLAGIAVPALWERPLSSRGEERMRSYVAMAARFLDTLQGMVTLKAFGATGRRRAALRDESERLLERWTRETEVALVSFAIYAAATVGGLATVVAVGAYRTADGGLAPKALFLALLLGAEALRAVATLAMAFHTSYDASNAADHLRDLFARPVPVVDGPRRGVGELVPSIAFEGVTFAYAADEPPVLRNLSLRVDAGETAAVVGPSGAGKSTLVALLARFFDPDAGTVRLGGVDVRDPRLDALRSMISVVSQDTYLFGGSARENIAMARPGATADEVEAAARVAGAHEFISALPAGYGTELGERGLRLSGGQRQRIAIARAVLADRPILVLDEATASVDARTEESIQAALDHLTAGRTTLVIAHRLSTVRNADRIHVLDAGRIVEEGRHDALLARAGRYSQLVAAQEVH